jgi:hypothetical protein
MSDLKSRVTNDLLPDIESVRADIAALRKDVKRLAAHSQRSAAALGREIEERPVLSLLVALTLGFLGGKLLSR